MINDSWQRMDVEQRAAWVDKIRAALVCVADSGLAAPYDSFMAWEADLWADMPWASNEQLEFLRLLFATPDFDELRQRLAVRLGCDTFRDVDLSSIEAFELFLLGVESDDGVRKEQAPGDDVMF